MTSSLGFALLKGKARIGSLTSASCCGRLSTVLIGCWWVFFSAHLNAFEQLLILKSKGIVCFLAELLLLCDNPDGLHMSMD